MVELFLVLRGSMGFAYRSAFGEHSSNFALFDLECAELRGCQLHEVSSINMNFRPRDNPYWVNKVKKKVRNNHVNIKKNYRKINNIKEKLPDSC